MSWLEKLESGRVRAAYWDDDGRRHSKTSMCRWPGVIRLPRSEPGAAMLRLMNMRNICLGAVVLLTAISCGGPTQQRVTGMLREAGGPEGASQPGVSGQVVFHSGDKTIAVKAAADGTFEARLPPGRYDVTGSSPQYGSGEGICRSFEPVAVAQSAISGVTVACDRK